MAWSACVGLDWGEREHAYVEQAAGGKRVGGSFSASSEGVHEWVRAIRERHPSGTIAIIVEQSRGSLIYALMAYEFLEIIPVNPRASKAYRTSRRLSGASSDPLDADLLCDFGLKHEGQLPVWRPDDPVTRRLRFLGEARRGFVDQRTALSQQLRAALKLYFPQALEWFGGETSPVLRVFLTRWLTLDELRAATPADLLAAFRSARCRKLQKRVKSLLASLSSALPMTMDRATIDTSALEVKSLLGLLEPLAQAIKDYDRTVAEVWATHPDRELFDALPGAGPVLAPRLAVAFGTDRGRYSDASEIQCYSGIAPVREQSGKQSWVHARWSCPKFLRQTFHEFAQSSIPKSRWAKAVYQEYRERGAGHHAAIRSLAFRWIRILFAVWSQRSPFDEAIHIKRLQDQASPIVRRLAAA